MKFAHAMIRVADIDKSMRFYCDLLGLKVAKTMDLEDCRLYYLTDSFGNTHIELTHNHETPDGGYKNGSAFGHFAFETEDLDEFTKKLRSMGYDYTEPPFMLEELGIRISFIEDPDGNAIEVIEA